MVDVKEVARQVVEALPADADFSDLHEFLFERSQVEDGRDDFASGRKRPLKDVASSAVNSTAAAASWSEHAANEFAFARRESHSASPEEIGAFETAVIAACESIVAAPERGLSLPEMGDRSVREVRIKTPSGIKYRILYDALDTGARILWFTTNITCYRNITASAEPSSEDNSR